MTRNAWLTLIAIGSALTAAAPDVFAGSVRARDLGVPFDGQPGPLNAITDVKGLEVGYTTKIKGEGKLVVGKGPVRTGVTVIFPRGKDDAAPVYGGWFSQNGNGEMTGTTWLEESGLLDVPVAITNTHSVGTVRDSLIAWNVGGTRKMSQPWLTPIVAETFDGFLNDINGFHVTKEDVFAAIDGAHGGPIAEGSVGGGTGMVCYGFKGGNGTSSRVIAEEEGGYTVGVLVQCNCGFHTQLTIAGVPMRTVMPMKPENYAQLGMRANQDLGSIIIVVATDAPLLPDQLKRLARRATMGLARTGSTSGNGSGDIFLAFSTANREATSSNGMSMMTGKKDGKRPTPNTLQAVSNDHITALFQATVEATEEAIINAMVAAPTMTGINGVTVEGLPHDKVRELVKFTHR